MLTTPKSWLTSSHVCGHVTRATWHLKVPGDRSFAVDDFRHWNFSITLEMMGGFQLFWYLNRSHKSQVIPTSPEVSGAFWPPLASRTSKFNSQNLSKHFLSNPRGPLQYVVCSICTTTRVATFANRTFLARCVTRCGVRRLSWIKAQDLILMPVYGFTMSFPCLGQKDNRDSSVQVTGLSWHCIVW